MKDVEEYFRIFHEIKNSITFIGSSLQLLEKEHPEIVSYGYWDEALEEFRYLREIVNELSSQRKNSELAIKPIALDQILHSVYCSIKSMEETHSFYVKMSIAENLPLILADEYRLKSAIANLIKNAYEAMNETGTIFLRAFYDETQVKIELQDFGGGIPKEIESRIFDAFYTSKQGGTGLGLSITKDFLLEMNAAIAYESRPGDGCTFTLLLPAEQTQTEHLTSSKS